MAKAIGIVVLVLFSWVSADPYYFSAPYYAPRYASALTAAPVAATIPTAPVPAVPAFSTVPAIPTVPAVPAVPASWPAPVSSQSAYAYGSGYNVQKFPVVNSALTALVYDDIYSSSLPWAYASDYFYRR